jgi:hypothetical protein
MNQTVICLGAHGPVGCAAAAFWWPKASAAITVTSTSPPRTRSPRTHRRFNEPASRQQPLSRPVQHLFAAAGTVIGGDEMAADGQ